MISSLKTQAQALAQEFIKFVNESNSPYHVVGNIYYFNIE